MNKPVKHSESTQCIAVVDTTEAAEPTSSSIATKIIGYAASFIGGAFSQELVSELAKEDVSAHELHPSDGMVEAVQKGINRTFDLKLWKSNVANLVVLCGGILLTDHIVKKMEHKSFAKRHKTLSADQRSWQDKTQQIDTTPSNPSI